MHSRLLVSGLPRSLPSLPCLLALPCLPCVEGRQRPAPQSSSFPPTTALQTLRMDVWGPARVRGQDQERYFSLVLDDYTRYTTVLPLRSKADVRCVLIDRINAVCCQLSARFQQDLQILRLHSDRGREFSSCLLEDFCCAEGIAESFTLLASPQQNGIAERRIGLIMEVARTSMIHAAAPHFLWPFAVKYAAHQLSLWPRFSQRQGVDFFQTFSPTPKMTTLWVLLHVAAQRDYELHSLDFSTTFLQGSLHEKIWLRRPPGFTGTTLAALGFAPSTGESLLFLRTDPSLPPFYILVYVDDLVFAIADTEALTLMKAELQKRHTCADLGPSALQLLVLLATVHSSAYRPLALSSTFGRVRKAEWPVSIASGLPHYIGHGARAWRTRSSGTHRTLRRFFGRRPGDLAVVTGCEVEIYAGAMAAEELRWLTYLLADLGEWPRSPPVLYVDNKSMIALCQEQRLEHKTKHIALCYFLAQELQ
ncbi:unnamed protein product [Closterium sp. NIES-53]